MELHNDFTWSVSWEKLSRLCEGKLGWLTNDEVDTSKIKVWKRFLIWARVKLMTDVLVLFHHSEVEFTSLLTERSERALDY